MNKAKRLQELAESQRGVLLPDAAPTLNTEDWLGYWPIVDQQGRVTGDVVASDNDVILVDWDTVSGQVKAWKGACEAAMRRDEPGCESCGLTVATTHSINPDFSGYELCDECATEYDSRKEGAI